MGRPLPPLPVSRKKIENLNAKRCFRGSENRLQKKGAMQM